METPARAIRGALLAAALAAALASCRREAPPADGAGATKLFFPRLHDTVILKIDPPEEEGDANGATEAPPSDLFIDRFEVTDGEFAEFLTATRYRPEEATLFLDHWKRGDDGAPAPPERDTPVRWVSLDDALAYARFRGKEVPTRDEWLAACPSIASGLLPWSGRVRAGACNSSASGFFAPTPVGMYQLGRTPSGCYDMVGNVAEWTTTDASGPEMRCIMGGSFTSSCDADREGRAGEARTPGATFARTAEEREALMEPWLDRLQPDLRRGYVGFRCIVRGAAQVVEEALDAVDAMQESDRRLALAELAQTGVWPSSSENRLDPFVHEILLRRRVRFELAADGKRRDALRIARCDVTRVGGRRGGDDLLLIGDDAVTLLDGRDGAIAFQRPLPGCGGHPRHGFVAGRDGVERVWVEGPGGAIELVDWRGGRSESVPAIDRRRTADPVGPQPTTWCASDPDLRGDAWFVQSFEVRPSESGPSFPRTRVVRVGADGVHERELAGTPPVAPARASDDGLFLPLAQPLELSLPIGRRSGRQAENLGYVSALRLGADLATTGAVRVADGRVRLPPIPRSIPSDVAADRPWNDLAFTRFVAAGCVTIDAPSFGLGPWLLPTGVPASYFVRDGSGRLFLWSGAKDDSLLPRPLPPPEHGDWIVLPAEGDWSEPLLLSRDGRELREFVAGSLVPRARDLGWSGDPVFGALVASKGRPLVVRTRAGDWFGVALDDPARRFAHSLGRAAIGAQVTRLSDGRAAVSAQSTPFDAWVRDVERFDQVDEAGVVRPPIAQFVVADLDGRGRFDPVLVFHDGRLVALRPPDPRLARLAGEWRVAASGSPPREPR